MNKKSSRFFPPCFAAGLERLFVAACALCALVLLAGCSPTLSVKAEGADGAAISFLTGFSDATARLVRSLLATVGADAGGDEPLFSAEDLRGVLEAGGFSKIDAKNVSSTTINASASYPNLRTGELAKTGILSRTATSLTLTLGPRQLWALYALSNEETQLYLELLMIPALSGDELTPAEYTSLLASLYGANFAGELAGGTLTLTLSSPDGKKRTSMKVTLGEILTLTEEKSWSITW